MAVPSCPTIRSVRDREGMTGSVPTDSRRPLQVAAKSAGRDPQHGVRFGR